MDRHFLVPASIAAALHAGLLLGPGAPAKPAITPVNTITCFNAFEFLKNLDLTPPDPATEEVSARSASSAAAPSLPELLVHPALEAFVVKVPESTQLVMTHPTSTLPLGPTGPDTLGEQVTRPAGPTPALPAPA